MYKDKHINIKAFNSMTIEERSLEFNSIFKRVARTDLRKMSSNAITIKRALDDLKDMRQKTREMSLPGMGKIDMSRVVDPKQNPHGQSHQIDTTMSNPAVAKQVYGITDDGLFKRLKEQGIAPDATIKDYSRAIGVHRATKEETDAVEKTMQPLDLNAAKKLFSTEASFNNFTDAAGFLPKAIDIVKALNLSNFNVADALYRLKYNIF